MYIYIYIVFFCHIIILKIRNFPLSLPNFVSYFYWSNLRSRRMLEAPLCFVSIPGFPVLGFPALPIWHRVPQNVPASLSLSPSPFPSSCIA